MEFDVCYEFAVARRMPWDGDHDTLQRHVAAVRDHIEKDSSVYSVATQTNPVTANLALDVALISANRQAAESDARRIVSEAIREAGAYHEGLLPMEEEIRLVPRSGNWSGLRTPTWRFRRVSLQLRRYSRAASV